MPLGWNEIKGRALRFSRDWADESSEDAEAQTFLNAFFDVFGVSRRRVANFEKKVKKIDGRDGYIDQGGQTHRQGLEGSTWLRSFISMTRQNT